MEVMLVLVILSEFDSEQLLLQKITSSLSSQLASSFSSSHPFCQSSITLSQPHNCSFASMAPQYNSHTTASELVSELASNIKGKVILTTGASPTSLGAHFLKAVAVAEPSLLILTGRNVSKLQETADAITKINSNVKTRVLKLELSSLQSVREAAAEVLAWDDVPVIDVLVNNAGIMAVDYALSPDGQELHFATNHLGHFVFTNLIMSKILASSEPRIVSVTSNGHRLSPVRFDSLDFDGGKDYNKWRAYGQSKTANILFASSLAKKLGGKGLVAVSVHPGVIGTTGLGTHIKWDTEMADLIAADSSFGDAKGAFDFKTEDEGVATHVFASFHPSLREHNGAYLTDAHVAEPDRDWAKSETDAEKLWKLSEDLVGQQFIY
ncbi:hypothetical protein QBC43DRAFT_318925 [Cladorrhinum sp. PSN259]|nr:hypothetical protein QBC43DRAFT_318925 [Cladorrhinum sp. PSN259]